MVETAVAESPREYQLLISLAGVLYRAGRIEEAIRRLHQAGATQPPSGANRRMFWLAMCRFRQGRVQEARQWLERGGQWLDRALEETAAGTANPPLTWPQRIVDVALRREAEELLRPADR